MYLTQQADYTMRLLIHLAVQPEGTSTIREVADHYQISRNHLVKVAHAAVQAGYVASVRGCAGGLRLALPAEKINVGRVLRAVEDWTTVECFSPDSNRCAITAGCGLRPVLKEAQDAYFAVLDRYTLADIAGKRRLLVQLLGMKAAG